MALQMLFQQDLNPDVPKGTYEAWANLDNGPPSGRELELANLLSFIKNNAFKNVVWVTADVHYAAASATPRSVPPSPISTRSGNLSPARSMPAPSVRTRWT